MADELSGLVRLREKDVPAAAAVLGRAFHNNPLEVFLFPDEAVRKRVTPYFFETVLRYGVMFGEVYAPSEKPEAVAMWLPSEYALMDPGLMKKAPGAEFHAQAGPEAAARLRSIHEFNAARHEKNAPFKHWYLSFIGVDPDCQGKGLASRLIKPMLARLDADNMPCYLETQTEENVMLYKHYGFGLLEQYVVPGTDFTLYAMLRKAAEQRGGI